MTVSDLFCDGFGAAVPQHGEDVREMPVCGIPAAFGKAESGDRVGSYATLFTGELTEDSAAGLSEAVCEVIDLLAAPRLSAKAERVLVTAFGNGEVLCDSLGQRTAEKIIVTGESTHGSLPRTYAVKTGVPAATGINSADTVRIFAERLKPDLVICIDSLVASRPERLCRAVQLTDAGIAPGSGVSAHVARVTASELGVPTIAIGVPTVLKYGKILLSDAKSGTYIPRAAAGIAGGINLYLARNCKG